MCYENILIFLGFTLRFVDVYISDGSDRYPERLYLSNEFTITFFKKL